MVTLCHWVTDGTIAGTTLVEEIRPGSSSSHPKLLMSFDDGLFFVANDGRMVANGRPPPDPSMPDPVSAPLEAAEACQSSIRPFIRRSVQG